MKGVQFLTDEHGNPKSIVLDIEEWGELWAFFRDGMLAEPARGAAAAAPPSTAKAADGEVGAAAASDGVSGADADPSTGPSFADRMEALCEQPPSQVRAVAMLRLLSQATPADKAELLQRALAKIDPEYEQRFAEGWSDEDLQKWLESDGAQDAQRGQADIERQYAQAARRAVDRSFPPSRRATDWDDGALKRELARMTDEDRREMQAIADEGLEEDLKHWPEYDGVSGADADPSTGPSFADRMEALCEQPPSQVRAVAMLRLLSQATPADKAELLQRALAKIDPEYEQRFAEGWSDEDLQKWLESDGAQDAQRGQADIERQYAQAARRAVDRSFPPSRRATDWDDGAFERELAKIDDEYRQYMQEIAEEGIEADLREWPEY